MSAAEHTQGPWVVKRSGVIAQRESGEVVATCGFKVAVGSNEDDANARLIALAPEMLEALGCLLEPTYSRATAEHKARSLLARARGEVQS